MTLTDDIVLPTEEELKHREIPLTHNYLLSSAMWLGKYCDAQSKEFMLCRDEERDPRKCLKESHDVTDCGFEFFRKLKKTCPEELDWYTKCLDISSGQHVHMRCRPEQAIFDTCMYSHGFERAPFGYFNVVRIHKTDRPPPKKLVPVFPDAVPDYDPYSEDKKKPAVGGRQGYWGYQTWGNS